MSTQAGNGLSSVSPRRFATRRRLLLLGCFLVVVVAAIVSNYGPLHRLEAARGRLDGSLAEVAALEEQKAQLQTQLAKLGQARYLEGLAREELSYARPGEDLYIVTEQGAAAGIAGQAVPGVDADATNNGADASPSGLDLGIGLSGIRADGVQLTPGGETDVQQTTAAGDDDATDGAPAAKPGVLERILSSIASLF
jgi:cell division protein FtsB